MNERMSWDEYRAAHDVESDEEPAAFAAYLHYLSEGRWDGEAKPVESDSEDS